MTAVTDKAMISDANFPSLTLKLEGSGARLNYRCKDREEFDRLTGGVAGSMKGRIVSVTHDGNKALRVESAT